MGVALFEIFQGFQDVLDRFGEAREEFGARTSVRAPFWQTSGSPGL